MASTGCLPRSKKGSSASFPGCPHIQADADDNKDFSVIDAVKSGAIRRFFVMAGCDGRMKSREYNTELARRLPKDTVTQ